MIVKVRPKKVVYINDQWYQAGDEIEVDSTDGIKDLIFEESNSEVKLKPKNKKKDK